MQEVAWTIKEVGFISKQRCACTSIHLLEHAHFSSFLFWACWSWEPWQPNTEGRKICAAWPSSIPLAVMLKLFNPMTKTTFHISVIVFKEFLLNRGISQRAYLIVLKPSGVTCECEFFCRSAQPDTHFFVSVHTCGSLHCLRVPAVDICACGCVWAMDVSKYSRVKSFFASPPESYPRFMKTFWLPVHNCQTCSQKPGCNIW